MKTNLKQKNNDKPGHGHKAKLAVVGKAVTEIDGQKSEFKIDWSFELTIEEIDYAIRLVAGRISEIASRVAGNGLSTRETTKVK
jgi:galactokinase